MNRFTSGNSIDWRWFGSALYRFGVTLMLAFIVWMQVAQLDGTPIWWDSGMARVALVGVVTMAYGTAISLCLWALDAGKGFGRWRANE